LIRAPSPMVASRSLSAMGSGMNASAASTSHYPPSATLIGYAYSALGAVLFATKGIFIKLAYAQGLDTETLLALRMVFSVPVFAGIALFIWLRRPRERRPSPRLLIGGAAVGVLGYFISSWLDFTGLSYLSAQLERLILFTYPFFTIIFAALLLRHPIKPHSIAGAAVSYAGLLLVMLKSGHAGHGAIATGGAFVLAAAVSFGLYQVLAREFIVRVGGDFYTGLAMSTAGICAFVLFGATGHHLADFAVSPKAMGIAAGLALFATIFPAFAMAAGLGRIGAQGTAVIGTLSPLVTTVLAVVLLGEPFGMVDAIGTLLVVGGVGLYTVIDSRARARPAAPVSQA